MKATAIAPANIAFIKYWGKVDPVIRVPNNNSISMNLSQMTTTTTVEFLPKLLKDDVTFIGEDVIKETEVERISKALDAVRKKTGSHFFAKVVTKNSFPKATGIASSASGFASLAVASFHALKYSISEKDLSVFCRQLSGTACRSIPDGFVEWKKGTGSDESYAYELYPPDYWDICDVIAIVTKTMKKVGSTEGHAIADTSPFYLKRLSEMDKKIESIKKAMEKKNFTEFGNSIEAEALNMHAICLTSFPPLIYWEPTTIEIMKKVQAWREDNNVMSYFTIDAGPTVHIICEGKNAEQVVSLLQSIQGIQSVVVNRPTVGAHSIKEDLF